MDTWESKKCYHFIGQMCCLGPDMEGEDKVGARTAFKQLLNQHIAIGTVWQSVFEIERKKRTLSAAEYLFFD